MLSVQQAKKRIDSLPFILRRSEQEILFSNGTLFVRMENGWVQQQKNRQVDAETDEYLRIEEYFGSYPELIYHTLNTINFTDMLFDHHPEIVPHLAFVGISSRDVTEKLSLVIFTEEVGETLLDAINANTMSKEEVMEAFREISKNLFVMQRDTGFVHGNLTLNRVVRSLRVSKEHGLPARWKFTDYSKSIATFPLKHDAQPKDIVILELLLNECKSDATTRNANKVLSLSEATTRSQSLERLTVDLKGGLWRDSHSTFLLEQIVVPERLIKLKPFSDHLYIFTRAYWGTRFEIDMASILADFANHRVLGPFISVHIAYLNSRRRTTFGYDLSKKNGVSFLPQDLFILSFLE